MADMFNSFVTSIFGGSASSSKPSATATSTLSASATDPVVQAPGGPAVKAAGDDKAIGGSVDDAKIIMVLDASGSMQDIRDDMIGAVNTFLDDQKKLTKDKPTFSLLQFDHNLRWIKIDVPLETVQALTAAEYRLGGTTALFDAVGTACDKFAGFKNVTLTVITDGDDNASKQHTLASIKTLLTKKQNEDGWDVMYLSADASGFKAGADMGIQQSNNVCANKKGMSSAVSAGISSAIFAKRVAKSTY